jgi:hypothetical protein
MAILVEKIGSTLCEVTGGFNHTEVYVAKVSSFDSLIAPKDKEGPNAATTLADLVTISGDHIFKTGLGFTKIKAIKETVKLETSQIGDATKSPVQENKMTVQMLGSEAQILGFKRWAKGEDLIVIAIEFESGNVRQIGSAQYGGIIIESNSKIEETINGENTTTLVFQDKQKYDAPIYTGQIVTQPAG